MQEKRKFPRLNYDVEVEWIKDIASASRDPAFNTARNISGGGICLMVDESVAQDDTLQLTITLPTQEIISSRGIVRWVEPFAISSEKRPHVEAGIEFTDINEDDRGKIRMFIFDILAKPS